MNRGLAASLIALAMLVLFSAATAARYATIFMGDNSATFYVIMGSQNLPDAKEIEVRAYTPELEIISSSTVSIYKDRPTGVYFPESPDVNPDDPYLVTTCTEEDCTHKWYWPVY